MASLCSQCAGSLHAAVRISSRAASRRAFSQSVSRKRSSIPVFNETSNAELDDVLSTMREKHFNFGYLPRREQRMLLTPANKQMIEDHPRSVRVGAEEVELKWVDRRKDVPAIGALFKRAIDLMCESEDGTAFRELPSLVIGLNGMKKPLTSGQIAKIVRKAVAHGKVGAVLECIEQANRSGMHAASPAVYEPFCTGLRGWVHEQGWSKEALAKALKDIRHLARLMEAEVERKGKSRGKLTSGTNPMEDARILAISLELSAAYVKEAHAGKDEDGQVEMYARGLIKNFSKEKFLESTEPRATGPQVEVIYGVPMLHGLQLARTIVNERVLEGAPGITSQVEKALSKIVSSIEAEQPQSGSYKAEALALWKQYKSSSA